MSVSNSKILVDPKFKKEILTVDDFLANRKWCLPYNDADLKLAIEFGKQLVLSELKEKMVAMNVNGTMQNIITEEQLKEVEND